ncbi:hypothetical protein F5Y19DRAFT_469984 [Xylariaceae sp. FL1651]|nr:hypothetical protein F5Y19DRAFT_469984 [Xylariaceae sp. FL1651]
MSRMNCLGPLTTAWSQPATCHDPVFSSYWNCYSGVSCTAAAGRACGGFTSDMCIMTDLSSELGSAPGTCFTTHYTVSTDDAECWPPSTSTYTPGPYLSGWGFYSPGLVCPEGYYNACSATYMGSYDFQPQFPLTTGETAVGCCPSFLGQICDETSTTYTRFAVPTVDILTAGAEVWNTTVTSIVLFAPMYQLNWQKSDRPASSHADKTGTGESTSETPAPSQHVEASSHSGGLSTASKVGIGVGIGLGVLAGFAGLVWFVLRRRQANLGERQLVAVDVLAGMAPELDGREKFELDGQDTEATTRTYVPDKRYEHAHEGQAVVGSQFELSGHSK